MDMINPLAGSLYQSSQLQEQQGAEKQRHIRKSQAMEKDVAAGIAERAAGIRTAFQSLAQRLDSVHEAHHQIMECLGEMIWVSQRNGLPPDGLAYIECVKKRCS